MATAAGPVFCRRLLGLLPGHLGLLPGHPGLAALLGRLSDRLGRNRDRRRRRSPWLLLAPLLSPAILLASPEVNAFFGAKGVAGAIPAAYVHIERQFYSEVCSLGQQERVQLQEYWRKGWTLHAKGMQGSARFLPSPPGQLWFPGRGQAGWSDSTSEGPICA
ncbi:CDP-diacylglycerol--glycerol-3-phosphate 3-phosphatidyltransferase, mitochondrial [Heterocephalus glaber]|uniref:CDP-diacylglycerol--glycerol-3-phosphate 3-phosphatidyltransferase n=1 Tax=Heterocephalus glaber TaxID=10181 RepID=G5AVI4_HETGA|nr:CDP-diacylglycerol--glycerol-3-phosphate 3-phosphatidyltransferase, mitochondrial [Heterocephalus glaber]